MCSEMNQPMARRSAHDVGDAWTTVDAAEMYEIARWGQGYFSIGENGHVKIHPTKEVDRSIDLKQLVDHLQLRGINLPTLVRFRDILRHRLQDVSKPYQRRQVDAPQLQMIDQLLQVDRAVNLFRRVDLDVSVLANRKVALPPAGNLVHLGGIDRGPGFPDVVGGTSGDRQAHSVHMIRDNRSVSVNQL